MKVMMFLKISESASQGKLAEVKKYCTSGPVEKNPETTKTKMFFYVNE
jgi:hypothetical protein